MPLDPKKARHLEQRIYYSHLVSPQGSRLIVSLLTATTLHWRSSTNLPITLTRSIRFQVFPEFWHRYVPSNAPQAELTPWKLGIAYCWAIDGAIKQQIWPGNITAHIYDSDNGALKTYLGHFVVLDSAPTNTVNSTPALDDWISPDTTRNGTLISAGTSSQSASDAGNALIQQNSAMLEKAYLETISKLLFFAVQHSSYEKVSLTYRLGVITHFASNAENSIESRLRMIADPQGNDLTWDHVAQIILRLGTDVANHRDWPNPRWAQIQLEGQSPWAQVWVGPKNTPSPNLGTDAGIATS